MYAWEDDKGNRFEFARCASKDNTHVRLVTVITIRGDIYSLEGRPNHEHVAYIYNKSTGQYFALKGDQGKEKYAVVTTAEGKLDHTAMETFRGTRLTVPWTHTRPNS